MGGGVAGLAAARHLVHADRTVLLLEARERLGGRVHTLIDPGTGHPVELGAEFLQGKPEALLAIVRSAGLELHEIPERHVRATAGERRDFPEVEKLVGRLLESAAGLPDMPVAQLLRKRSGIFRTEELEAVTSYLEGFHAADLERFGTAALAENQKAEEEDAESICRFAGGYGRLVDELQQELKSAPAQIQTGAVVTGLSWKPGSVTVEARAGGQRLHVSGSQAVIAVPLNTLKAGRGREGAFFPEPAPRGWTEALQKLETGAAQHIALRFERAWWIRPNKKPPVFVHGRDEPFPVWWTASPPDLPFLTGWAGGPRAFKLAGLSIEQLVPLALQSAASVFGLPARKLGSGLRAAYSYDWTIDPYSRGGYSYGGVGALRARELLRKPVEETLVLSGEALAEKGRNATVPGALTSGYRSAQALLG